MKHMTVEIAPHLSPDRSYTYVKSNFNFASIRDINSADVCPFVIVNDGIDILVFKNINERIPVEIGLSFQIDKPKRFFLKTKKNFDKLIKSQIKKKFLEMFESIKIVDAKIEKKSSRDMDQNDLKIFDTQRAIYNLDKTKVQPIYFVALPQNKIVNLIPRLDNLTTITPVNVFVCFGEQFSSLKLHYITKTVMNMMRDGNVLMPNIKNAIK